MISDVAVIFGYGHETHGIFQGRKAGNDFRKEAMWELVPSLARHQELQETIPLGQPSSFKGTVSSQERVDSGFRSRPPAS